MDELSELAQPTISQEGSVAPKWQRAGRRLAVMNQTPWMNKGMSVLPNATQEDKPDMPPNSLSEEHMKEEVTRHPTKPLKPDYSKNVLPMVTSNTSGYATTKANVVLSEDETGPLLVIHSMPHPLPHLLLHHSQGDRYRG